MGSIEISRTFLLLGVQVGVQYLREPSQFTWSFRISLYVFESCRLSLESEHFSKRIRIGTRCKDVRVVSYHEIVSTDRK